jgi:hypothetical protein
MAKNNQGRTGRLFAYVYESPDANTAPFNKKTGIPTLNGHCHLFPSSATRDGFALDCHQGICAGKRRGGSDVCIDFLGANAKGLSFVWRKQTLDLPGAMSWKAWPFRGNFMAKVVGIQGSAGKSPWGRIGANNTATPHSSRFPRFPFPAIRHPWETETGNPEPRATLKVPVLIQRRDRQSWGNACFPRGKPFTVVTAW